MSCPSPTDWEVLPPPAVSSSRPEYHGHNSVIKHYADVVPTLSLLSESVVEWYPRPPDSNVKVAIVTRPCNNNWLYNFGTHWGVYIDGVYIHWYGTDITRKEWMCRHSSLDEFTRDGRIVTYVLADYYHHPVKHRMAQNFTPGPYHALHNNCQHAIQKLVYGEILSCQTNALLNTMDMTQTDTGYNIWVPSQK